MALYVMLEFDDDQDGVKDIRIIHQQGTLVHASGTARVRGVWKRPKAWCVGPDDGHMKSATARNRYGRLRRGRLFGWHVCVDCGKPSPHHIEYESTTRMRLPELGYNLLPPKYSGETSPWWKPKSFLRIDPTDEVE